MTIPSYRITSLLPLAGLALVGVANAQQAPITLTAVDNGAVDRATSGFGTIAAHVGMPAETNGSVPNHPDNQHRTYQMGRLAFSSSGLTINSETRSYFVFDTSSVPAGVTSVTLRLWMFREMRGGVSGLRFDSASSAVGHNPAFEGYTSNDVEELLFVRQVEAVDVLLNNGTSPANAVQYIAGLLPYGAGATQPLGQAFDASHTPVWEALGEAPNIVGQRVFSAADALGAEPSPSAPPGTDCGASGVVPCGQWIDIDISGLVSSINDGDSQVLLGASLQSLSASGLSVELLFRNHYADTLPPLQASDPNFPSAISNGFGAPSPQLVLGYSEVVEPPLPVPMLGGRGGPWGYLAGLALCCVGLVSTRRLRRERKGSRLVRES